MVYTLFLSSPFLVSWSFSFIVIFLNILFRCYEWYLCVDEHLKCRWLTLVEPTNISTLARTGIARIHYENCSLIRATYTSFPLFLPFVTVHSLRYELCWNLLWCMFSIKIHTIVSHKWFFSVNSHLLHIYL